MGLRINPRYFVLALATVALVFGAITQPAAARVFVGFGFGFPGPYYYPPYPPPYYYPPPVVYTPPPVVVAPPAPPVYTSQPPGEWYYCDNPRGYYPYVSSCSTAWRAVPAQPPSVPPQR